MDSIVLRTVVEGPLDHSSVDIGEGRRDLSGRTGGIYVAPANALALWQAEGEHSVLMLAFHKTLLPQLLGTAEDGVDPLRALYGRETFHPALAHLMHRIWAEAESDAVASSLLVDGLFMTLLAGLVRTGHDATLDEGGEAPLDARRLRIVLEYMDAHMSGPLTIGELADVACLSAAHFTRRFRAASGLTPHAYLTQARVDRARDMIGQGVALSRVAYECGFSSQSHFTQTFKSRTGTTPSAYRAAL